MLILLGCYQCCDLCEGRLSATADGVGLMRRTLMSDRCTQRRSNSGAHGALLRPNKHVKNIRAVETAAFSFYF